MKKKECDSKARESLQKHTRRKRTKRGIPTATWSLSPPQYADEALMMMTEKIRKGK